VAFIDLAQFVMRALAMEPLETVAISLEAAKRKVVLKSEMSGGEDNKKVNFPTATMIK
jgi:hypothetical protein